MAEKEIAKGTFDPNTAFFDLAITWRFFWGILVAAGSLALYIACSSTLEWRLGYEGVNKAIVIFKVPLAILALLIPIIAVLATNHRSEQNKAAMKLAKSQNEFANHYKHIEEFEKHCKSVVEYLDKETYFINGRSIYHHLFEITSDNIGQLKKEAITAAREFNAEVIDVMESFKNRDPEVLHGIERIDRAVTAFDLFMSEFDYQFGIQPGKKKTGEKIEHELRLTVGDVLFPDGQTKRLFERYLNCLKMFDLVLQFDLSYFKERHSNESVNRINEIERASSLVKAIVGGHVNGGALIQNPFIHSK